MLKKFVDAYNTAKNNGKVDEKTEQVVFNFKFEEFDVPECRLMLSKQKLNKFRTVDVLQNLDTRRSVILGSGRYEVAKGILNVVLPSANFDVTRHQQTVQQRAAAIKAQKEAIRAENIETAFVEGGFCNEAKAIVEKQLKGKFANSIMLYMREFTNNPKLKMSENNPDSFTGFVYKACCMIGRDYIEQPEFNQSTGRYNSHIPNTCFKRYMSNKFVKGIPGYVIEARDYLFHLLTYLRPFQFHKFCLWFTNLHDVQHPETNVEMTCTLEEARIEEETIKAKAWKERRNNGDFQKRNFMKDKETIKMEKPKKQHKEIKHTEKKVVTEDKPKSMGSLGELLPDFDFSVDEANVNDFIEDTAETTAE